MQIERVFFFALRIMQLPYFLRNKDRFMPLRIEYLFVLSPGEYLLIENRQAIRWSADMPASGIVIYHVDEKVKDMKSRGYPGHPNWPRDHYPVTVLQADGKYDIEHGENLGDEGDFWTVNGTNNILGPNIDGMTWPNTDTYQDGVVKQTGIKISVFTESGFIMFFKVEGITDGGIFEQEFVPADVLSASSELRESGSANGTTHLETSETTSAAYIDQWEIDDRSSTTRTRRRDSVSAMMMLGVLSFYLGM